MEIDGGPHALCENQHDIILGWIGCFRLGMLLASPADAKQRNRPQQAYGGQSYNGGITVMPRNTPRSNVVCWTPCDQSNAIVMGADPDPFIRQQILRDANGFFGGTK